MERKEILEQAIKAVCTDRDGQYGSPENNFKVIAEFWTDYLRNSRTLNCGSISAKDVAVMMTLFKIARITTGKHKDDNFVDLAGYAACAAELGCDDALQQIENKDHKTPNVLPENLFDVEAGSEIEELRSENEKLKEENEQLSTRISVAEESCRSWKDGYDNFKKELLSEREVKGKLMGEIKALRAASGYWFDKCKELGGISGDVSCTEQLNHEADNSATEVEEELETKEVFCESDLQEIEKLKSDKKLLKYRERIERLESQIKSLEYGNSQLFKSWTMGNDTIKRMSKELKKKSDKCANLKKENEELKQEKEFSKMYKSELEHSKEDIKALKDRIYTLYNERDYLKGKNECLKAENNRLSQAVSVVEAEK